MKELVIGVMLLLFNLLEERNSREISADLLYHNIQMRN